MTLVIRYKILLNTTSFSSGYFIFKVLFLSFVACCFFNFSFYLVVIHTKPQLYSRQDP